MKAILVLSLLSLLAVPFGTPTVAEESGSTEADPATFDPVIASVVRMLEQKVPFNTISTWLDQIEYPPETVSAEEVIALTNAGASDELLQKILGLSRSVKTPTPGVAEREQTQTSGDPIPVQFQVSYSPQVVDERTTPWDLFVYLDGVPLARGDGWAGNSTAHVDWMTFELPLTPGRHVVRLLQEQHELKSKRKGTWSHAAFVMGGPIFVDLDADGFWNVRIAAREGMTTMSSSSVEFEITRDGETQSDGRASGLKGKALPPLCEEVEDTLSAKERSTKSGRAAMRNCVRWPSLWEGVEGVPERAVVRERMQEIRFDVGPS